LSAIGVSAAPIEIGGKPAELVLSEISAHAIRVQISPLNDTGRPQTMAPSPVLTSFPQDVKFRARDVPKEKQIRMGDLRVVLQPEPFSVSVRRRDGTLVQQLISEAGTGMGTILFHTDGPVLGLGEGADQFDRRGANYPVINGQRYRLAELGARVFSPFLIGTDGWALFVSTPNGAFDLRGGHGRFVPVQGAVGGVDVFVIDAHDPADALREFARLTGAPVMPPKWALGYMQSHRTLSTEEDILAEARTFREKKLPCDTMIFLGTGFCPKGWNFGHDSFELNTNVFTRTAADVLRDLHQEHFHVALHIVPLQKDYPTLNGSIPAKPGEEIDAQNIGPYWKRHGDLVAAGVDGWWPDEGDWFDLPSRLARHRMYYEGPLSDRPNVRPWNLQRNGCPGIARYGGWIWSGDISSSWKTFAAQVKVGQNSSLSVSPFWGTDIGGFYPSTNMDYTGELYARWFQFAAFCPSFRSHGRTWHLHLPWGWNTGETGPIESRPPPDPSELHNAEVEPVCREYLNLRYQLMPYTYTLAREAHDSGMPFMRALWLHYPSDPEAAGLGDEYLWGRDLLIAPVVEKGATSRRVYLPKGAWFDWWTADKVDGGKWIDRPVDLKTMPIYVRAGAIIPIDPVRQYLSEPTSQPTTLRVFPGADGAFMFYDDDGESLGYLEKSDPKIVWIRGQWDESSRLLTLEPMPGAPRARGLERVFLVECLGKSTITQRIVYRGSKMKIQL
jgi:alpha-glucosidase/alpha-D-xyloside xylohydrolase